MEITETRKKIIEILEPYMNKTLSEGCLIKTKPVQIGWGIVNFWKIIFLDKDWEIGIFYEQANYLYKYNLEEEKKEYLWNWIIKIIWHYNITAVLKFIKNKWDYTVEFHEDFIWIVWQVDYAIPNNPLHLYTQEEDEHLLEILTKLK